MNKVIKKWLDGLLKINKNVIIDLNRDIISLLVTDVNNTKHMFNLSFDELRPYIIDWLVDQGVIFPTQPLIILCSE
jgi:hypothetical protein